MGDTPAPVHIVLVEDNPDDIEIMRRALERRRVTDDLIVARDGQEALDILFSRGNGEAPKVSLILLDLNLPRVDGREVLEKTKADPKPKRIPVVVLTVSTQEEDVTRCYDTGVNTYITKPVQFDDFMRAVATINEYWVATATLPTVE